MKRAAITDKLARKRLQLRQRTADALAVDLVEAERLLRLDRQQSLRLNPLRAAPAQTVAELRRLGWRGRAYDWLAEGYSIETGLELVRDSQAVAEGRAYIQNAASWLPVIALAPVAGERLLDVCAAPGGKTSHLAARSLNQAHITANDNSRPRLAKLQAVCQRLDARVEHYSLFDGQNLARQLAGASFDKILLDAPCSGEGLLSFGRDADIATWSVAHIKRLQQLQKRLLFQAWQLLRPGGRLVYSTCTIAPEENELVIAYGLRSLAGASLVPIKFELANRRPAVRSWNQQPLDERLDGCLRLAPSQQLEAFFVATLEKTNAPVDEDVYQRPPRRRAQR